MTSQQFGASCWMVSSTVCSNSRKRPPKAGVDSTMESPTLKATKQFKRDAKRSKRRGKDMEKLFAVVDRLLASEPLDPKHRAHRLRGEHGAWECHIEPDWLLIWRFDGNRLTLVATGTHADLFE